MSLNRDINLSGLGGGGDYLVLGGYFDINSFAFFAIFEYFLVFFIDSYSFALLYAAINPFLDIKHLPLGHIGKLFDDGYK
jgi:hypothetical protein